MTYRYTIPSVPPSNNEYIGRDNRWKYQEIKKQWALLVAAYCRPRPPAPLEHASVTLVYCFGDNRRRDPDNYSGKMILDGLVKAGIIRDDSFKRIDLIKSCRSQTDTIFWTITFWQHRRGIFELWSICLSGSRNVQYGQAG